MPDIAFSPKPRGIAFGKDSRFLKNSIKGHSGSDARTWSSSSYAESLLQMLIHLGVSPRLRFSTLQVAPGISI